MRISDADIWNEVAEFIEVMGCAFDRLNSFFLVMLSNGVSTEITQLHDDVMVYLI